MEIFRKIQEVEEMYNDGLITEDEIFNLIVNALVEEFPENIDQEFEKQ